MSNALSNFPKVDPFSLSDKEISTYIISSHNPEAEINDVDYLYNKVSNIIQEANTSHHINKHLELKHGESKVSHGSNFVPIFHILKDISSQMTNKYFDAYTAHETIMWILEKLHKYNWATKGVTTLGAFALDYGKPWYVSRMAPTKTNSLQIHISSSEGLERPTNVTNKTLIDHAMQLIKITIDLDKLITKNDKLEGTAKSELYKVPQDIYTYWAIFALLACAGQMALDLKSKIGQRIGTILSVFSGQWKPHIAEIEDYLWRLNVFRSPSGVLQFLTALILPKDIPYPKIYDTTAKSLVNPDELKTKHLLLLISGVWYSYTLESRIEALLPIHESFMMDPKKSDYRILWIPVNADEWDEEMQDEFNEWKSMMPWYIVEYFELIKGYRVLDELWSQAYPSVFTRRGGTLGGSLIVVVDPQGNVLNPDASEMIIKWDDAKAFPFTKERENQLNQQYGWLWPLLREAGLYRNWLFNRSYIFVYGGTDDAQVKEFGELVEKIKKHTDSLSEEDVRIEHLNLGNDHEISEKFWSKVTINFQESILNRKDEDDNVLLEMEMLLAMKNEKAWALFSKGPLVLVVDYDIPIYDTLKDFEIWQTNITKYGFDMTFKDYYHMKRSQETQRHCYHFQLGNLPFAPQNVNCPEPDCKLRMKVKSIEYMCDHEKLNQHLKGTPKNEGDEVTLQS